MATKSKDEHDGTVIPFHLPDSRHPLSHNAHPELSAHYQNDHPFSPATMGRLTCMYDALLDANQDNIKIVDMLWVRAANLANGDLDMSDDDIVADAKESIATYAALPGSQ